MHYFHSNSQISKKTRAGYVSCKFNASSDKEELREQTSHCK